MSWSIYDVNAIAIPVNCSIFARMVMPRSFQDRLSPSRVHQHHHELIQMYRIVEGVCQRGWFYHGQSWAIIAILRNLLISMSFFIYYVLKV